MISSLKHILLCLLKKNKVSKRNLCFQEVHLFSGRHLPITLNEEILKSPELKISFNTHKNHYKKTFILRVKWGESWRTFIYLIFEWACSVNSNKKGNDVESISMCKSSLLPKHCCLSRLCNARNSPVLPTTTMCEIWKYLKARHMLFMVHTSVLRSMFVGFMNAELNNC